MTAPTKLELRVAPESITLVMGTHGPAIWWPSPEMPETWKQDHNGVRYIREDLVASGAEASSATE